MNYLRAACYTSLLLLWTGYSLAQVLPVKHFSAEDPNLPLPSQAVYSLFEDAFGYVWMSAYGAGLVRYDGQELELFNSEKGVSPLIVKMFQDRQGRLWACSRQHLLVSDRPLQAGSLDSLGFSDSLEGIPLLRHFSFDNTAIDSLGNIWAGDDSVLVRYRPGAAGSYAVDTIARYTLQPEVNLRALFSRRNGEIFGTLENGGHIVRLALKDSVLQFPDTLAGLISGQGLALRFEDQDGGLWAGGGQVYAYFPPGEQYPRIPVAASIPGRLRGMVQLDERTVLGGITGGGIFQFSTRTGAIQKKYGLEEGLTTLAVLDMIVDHDQSLWIGQATGADRMPADFRAFGAFIAEPKGEDLPALPESGVNVTLTGWPRQASSTGPRVSALAGTTKGLAVLHADGSASWLGNRGEMKSSIVLGLAADQEDRLWISSNQKEIYCLFPPGKQGRFPFEGPIQSLQFEGRPYRLGRIPSGFLYFPQIIPLPSSDAATKPVESLWGIARNLAQFLYQDRWIWLGPANGFSAGTPNDITHDGQGLIFIGGNGGLIRSTQAMTADFCEKLLREGENHRELAAVTLTKETALFEPVLLTWEADTFQNVNSLLWHEAQLWVGVDEGLLILDGEKLKPLDFIPLAGIKPACITLDKRMDIIWVGSDQGLFGLDPHSHQQNYRVREADGLRNESNWGVDVLSASTDGKLYYGTPQGLMVYKPWLDQPDSAAFPVYVQEATYTEDQWGKNALNLRFAALTYRAEETVRYRTRMVGYDQDWSAPTEASSLRYTNLPAFFFPKTYRFEVMAQDYRGQWRSGAPHTFQVSPPLWARWWAFLVYGLLLIFLIRQYTRWQVQVQIRKLALEEAAIIKQQRDEIQAQNAEKELLLKEIHHRVKNNLQTVSSLLNLQSEQIADDSVRQAVAAGQHRVESMALIHQKLYQRDNLAAIEMRDYLGQLIEGLLDTFGIYDGRITHDIQMEELELDVDSAVPLGLIVNELVTNSLKYAFPEGRSGQISIRMHMESPDRLHMSLRDDGVGLEGNKQASGTSFGSQLIQMLTRQLGGKMELDHQDGYATHFSFTRIKPISSPGL